MPKNVDPKLICSVCGKAKPADVKVCAPCTDFMVEDMADAYRYKSIPTGAKPMRKRKW